LADDNDEARDEDSERENEQRQGLIADGVASGTEV